MIFTYIGYCALFPVYSLTFRLIFIGMSSTTIWAIFLPKVKHSLYFPNKKTIEETSMGQSTVTIYNPEKYKDSQLSIEAAPNEEVCNIRDYSTT